MPALDTADDRLPDASIHSRLLVAPAPAAPARYTKVPLRLKDRSVTLVFGAYRTSSRIGTPVPRASSRFESKGTANSVLLLIYSRCPVGTYASAVPPRATVFRAPPARGTISMLSEVTPAPYKVNITDLPSGRIRGNACAICPVARSVSLTG